MGSWKPGIKNCEFGKEGSNLVSVAERMSTFLDIKSQRLSNLFGIEFMLIWVKIMFLGFFILKYPKNETLLVLLTEAKLVVLSATLSLKLDNQFGLRTYEKFSTNWVVPLLFKCDLLLLMHEPSHSAKIRRKDTLRTSPKIVRTSSGRPHMVLYVTPRDASLTGRPWDVLRTSF